MNWSVRPARPGDLDAWTLPYRGEARGLAHRCEWVRPLRGVVAGCLDDVFDLFADPDHRGSGAVDALFDAVRELAAGHDRAMVRWTIADDHARACVVYDQLAAATTWITHDMDPATGDGA